LGDDVLVRPSTALDLQTLTHMTDWYFPNRALGVATHKGSPPPVAVQR
jgi:hypothetical protein